jgi:hypothetical protein
METLKQAFKIYQQEGALTLLTKSVDKLERKKRRATPNFLRYSLQKKHLYAPNKFLKWEYIFRGVDGYSNDVSAYLQSEPSSDEIDISTVYPCSNDVVSIDTANDRPQIFVGVGNPTSIDVLSHLDPQEVYILDINTNQLKYLEFTLQLISDCDDRVEFLSRFYGKKEEEVREIIDDIAYDDGIDNLLEIEDRFWRSNDVDRPINNIHEELLKYQYKEINGNRVGAQPASLGTNMRKNLEITMSLVLGGEYDLDVDDKLNLFPIYRENGFLSNEARYKQIQNIIDNVDFTLIPNRMSGDLLHSIAEDHPYHELHLWLSNILYPGLFDSQNRLLTDKITFLREIANEYYSDKFYNIQIWEDERTPFFDSNILDLRSPHWDAFSAVEKYREGNSLEIRVDPERAKKDSYLPQTRNIHYSKLTDVDENIDSIFYHILVGHGLDLEEFKKSVETGFNLANNIIILEHNSESADFSENGKGVTIEEIRGIFGEPTNIEYTAGKNSADRNMVVVYRGENEL